MSRGQVRGSNCSAAAYRERSARYRLRIGLKGRDGGGDKTKKPKRREKIRRTRGRDELLNGGGFDLPK
jgi:hypothetical protein